VPLRAGGKEHHAKKHPMKIGLQRILLR